MSRAGAVIAACVAGIAGLPFVLLSFDPYFVDRLRPRFPATIIQLRQYLEAGDPAKPLERSILWAPERRKCEAEMLANAQHNCGGRCSIVFIGDSILDALRGRACYDSKVLAPRFKRILDTALPKEWRSIIIAGGGDQTQHALFHLERCLPALKSPKLFFLLLGSNNLALQGSMPPEAVIFGLRTVVKALQSAHPGVPVVLNSILPRHNDQATWQKDFTKSFQAGIDRTNKLMAEAFRDAPGVIHVDCTGVFPRGVGKDARALLPDLIHPNVEGYKRWFHCLLPTLNRVLNGTAAW